MSNAANKEDRAKENKGEKKHEHKGDQKQAAKRPFTVIGEPYFDENGDLKVKETTIEH